MNLSFLTKVFFLVVVLALPSTGGADELAVYAFDRQGAPTDTTILLASSADGASALAFSGAEENSAATFLVALPSDWESPRAEIRSADALRTLLRLTEPSYYSVSPDGACMPDEELQAAGDDANEPAAPEQQPPPQANIGAALEGWAYSNVEATDSGLSQLRLQQPRSINEALADAIFERHAGQRVIVASGPESGGDAALVLELPASMLPEAIGFDGTADNTLLVLADQRYDAGGSPNVMAPSGLIIRRADQGDHAAGTLSAAFTELAAAAHPDPVITTFASRTTACSRCDDAEFNGVATGLAFAAPPAEPALEGLRFVELINTAGRGTLDESRLAASMAFVADAHVQNCLEGLDTAALPDPPEVLMSFTLSPSGDVNGVQANGADGFDTDCLEEALSDAPLTLPTGGDVAVASRWLLELSSPSEETLVRTMGERALTRLEIPGTEFEERSLALRAADATTGGLPPAWYGAEVRRGAWLSSENRFESAFYFVDATEADEACPDGQVRRARVVRTGPGTIPPDAAPPGPGALIAMLVQPGSEETGGDPEAAANENGGGDNAGVAVPWRVGAGTDTTAENTSVAVATEHDAVSAEATAEGEEIQNIAEQTEPDSAPTGAAATDDSERVTSPTVDFVGNAPEPTMHVPHSGEPTKGCATTENSGTQTAAFALLALLLLARPRLTRHTS